VCTNAWKTISGKKAARKWSALRFGVGSNVFCLFVLLLLLLFCVVLLFRCCFCVVVVVVVVVVCVCERERERVCEER